MLSDTNNLAFAVVALAISIVIGATMAGKATLDAASRVNASSLALVAACNLLLGKFSDLTAELRQIAANAKDTTGDDASIQLNATADRLDQEVAAVAAAMAEHTGDDADAGNAGDDDGHPAIQLAGGEIPAGVVGQSYTNSLSASGGDGGPYSFACLNPPPGLSVNSTGGVSGTPATSGEYTFTVSASDGSGASGSADFTFKVSDAPA